MIMHISHPNRRLTLSDTEAQKIAEEYRPAVLVIDIRVKGIQYVKLTSLRTRNSIYPYNTQPINLCLRK